MRIGVRGAEAPQVHLLPLAANRGAYKTPRNGKKSIHEQRYISCINHHMHGQLWTSNKGPAPPITGGKGKGKGKGRG